ncbi:unnamed protein product [Heterotrigona itama]|uniref:Acyltransferase n=1 Tax=Heterotrigona itama TaxID=395501 RepID=A0A6V7H1B1_9HYME|nr:unnamed protein product [Heterotrigona itama]
MEIFGIKFAPLNVPLKRKLETLTVTLYFSILFLVIGIGYFAKYILAIYLIIYTKILRYFVFLYFIWMYYSDNSPVSGIRAQFKQWLRSSAIHQYICNYFPVKLVKTTDLDPNKLYLLCSFPHGILCTGVSVAFGTDAAGYKELFPSIDSSIVILDQHFKTPFFREYCRVNCTSSPESLNQLLSTKPQAPYTGRATVLIVGGAAEVTESKPNTYRIVMKRRKGFVKLALKNGVPIVPVCSFGETNLYDQLTFPEGSFMKKLQDFIRKKVGVPPVYLLGRGLFKYCFSFIPRRTPVTVVVGSPMDLPKIEEPTVEQIDEYHGKFIEHVVDFFEKEKHKYIENADSVHLEFIDEYHGKFIEHVADFFEKEKQKYIENADSVHLEFI